MHCLFTSRLFFSSGNSIDNSLAVFWRSQRGNIHYVVSSVGQNLTALCIGALSWAVFDIDYPATSVSMKT